MMNPDLQKSAQWILGTWPIHALLVSVHDEIWGNLLCHWCWAYSPDAWTLTDSGPVKGVACNCLTLETCVRKISRDRMPHTYHLYPLWRWFGHIVRRILFSTAYMLDRPLFFISFLGWTWLKHLNKVDVQPIGLLSKRTSLVWFQPTSEWKKTEFLTQPHFRISAPPSVDALRINSVWYTTLFTKYLPQNNTPSPTENDLNIGQTISNHLKNHIKAY